MGIKKLIRVTRKLVQDLEVLHKVDALGSIKDAILQETPDAEIEVQFGTWSNGAWIPEKLITEETTKET